MSEIYNLSRGPARVGGEIREILGHLTGYFIIWTQLFAETWKIRYARWNLQPADIDILFLTRHNSEYDLGRKKGGGKARLNPL